MARIYTTPEAEQNAKSFMHDVTLAAGIRTTSQRATGTGTFDANFVKASQEICDELVSRDFKNIDASINRVSSLSAYSSINGGNWKKLKPEGVAKAIVYLAEVLGLYWDDTIRTPYEIDEFKKTILGMLVYRYGRYISAIPEKTTKAAKSANVAGTNTPKVASSAPQNGYKQSGPQSGNVRDLRDVNGQPGGVPGAKVIANTAYIYKIIGDNPQSKNIPNVFIKPLSPSGAIGSTNKIFISSGNGYTDCTCYFDDPNDAQDFLSKINAAGRVPANISNLRVVKMKADPNGYFIVGTEFGHCAVSAKTLNEALTEAAKVAEGLSSWEKATENYSEEELEELHAWMRRD